VALALGAAVKIDERGVPCPFCGGRDRFSIDKAKNVFLCRASGAGGDPIALVQHVHQCSFAEAIEQLTGEKPLATGKRAPAQSDDEKNEWRMKARLRAWKIWRNGAPIEPERGGHWVRDYLAGCAASLSPHGASRRMREMSSLPYWHWSKSRRGIHRRPHRAGDAGRDHRAGWPFHRRAPHLAGSVAAERQGADTDPAGATRSTPRRSRVSQKGGKIVLRDGADALCLALGEGIETVLSWGEMQASASREWLVKPALWVGINIGNIAGKAAEMIPHPSLMLTDTIGRKRRQKVGGHEPDLSDTDCLQIPADDFES
jgi:hypothetical protein